MNTGPHGRTSGYTSDMTTNITTTTTTTNASGGNNNDDEKRSLRAASLPSASGLEGGRCVITDQRLISGLTRTCFVMLMLTNTAVIVASVSWMQVCSV